MRKLMMIILCLALIGSVWAENTTVCSNDSCEIHLLVVGDSSPSKDITILDDVEREFHKDFDNILTDSQVTKDMLENKVTVFLYDYQTMIIVGSESPTDHIVLGVDVEEYLEQQYGIQTEMKLSHEIESDDLSSEFPVCDRPECSNRQFTGYQDSCPQYICIECTEPVCDGEKVLTGYDQYGCPQYYCEILACAMPACEAGTEMFWNGEYNGQCKEYECVDLCSIDFDAFFTVGDLGIGFSNDECELISYDGRNAEICLDSVGNTVSIKYNGEFHFFDYGECRTIDEQKVCLKKIVCDSCELITYGGSCYDYGDYLKVNSGYEFTTPNYDVRVGEVDECADNSKCVYQEAVTVYVTAKSQGETVETRIVYIPLGQTQEIGDDIGLKFVSYDGIIKFQIVGTAQSCVVPACRPGEKLYFVKNNGDCNIYECRDPCAEAYISIDGYGLYLEQYACTMYYSDDYKSEICWHEMIGEKLGLKVNGEIGFFEEGDCRKMDGKTICLKDLDGCVPDKCELISYDGDCFDFNDYMKVGEGQSFSTPLHKVKAGNVNSKYVDLQVAGGSIEIEMGEIEEIEKGIALKYIAYDNEYAKFKILKPAEESCEVIEYEDRCYDYGDHLKVDTDDEFSTPNYEVSIVSTSSGGCTNSADDTYNTGCRLHVAITLQLEKCTSNSCSAKRITIEQGETEVIDDDIALEFISTDWESVKFEIHKDDVDCKLVEFENRCYSYGDYFKPEVKETFLIPGEIVTVSKLDDDNEYVMLSIEADCDVGEPCPEYIRSLKIAKGSIAEISDGLGLEFYAYDRDTVNFKIVGIETPCSIPYCDGKEPIKIGYENGCPIYKCPVPDSCEMIEFQDVCLGYGDVIKMEKKEKFYTTEEEFRLTDVDDDTEHVELFVIARCEGTVCPTYFRHITFVEGQVQEISNDISLKLLSTADDWANFKIVHPEDDDLPIGITPVLPEKCDGCVVKDRCVSYGIRMRNGDSKYCDISGSLLEQKRLGEQCENNYECVSNSCSNGKCIDLSADIEENASILKKIFDWLSRIFS